MRIEHFVFVGFAMNYKEATLNDIQYSSQPVNFIPSMDPYQSPPGSAGQEA